MKLKAVRYHDFCAGHRVVGHESKCANLHGHNYRIYFHCEAENLTLDEVGRVVDFSVIKETLCEWLETNWDHRMLIWEQDQMLETLQELDPKVVVVPFNPTAENIVDHLLHVVCPAELAITKELGYELKVTKIDLEETRKCSVTGEI